MFLLTLPTTLLQGSVCRINTQKNVVTTAKYIRLLQVTTAYYKHLQNRLKIAAIP